MRVLVVDDSKAIRDRLVAMIRELGGVRVWEAGDGHSALDVVLEHLPHLVVLDLRMPGENGLAVLPRMKAATVPPVVIVLTNHPGEQHRQQAMLLGADHFFDKSGDFERVLDVMRALVKASPAAARG